MASDHSFTWSFWFVFNRRVEANVQQVTECKVTGTQWVKEVNRSKVRTQNINQSMLWTCINK
jgi:hypothetical protein